MHESRSNLKRFSHVAYCGSPYTPRAEIGVAFRPGRRGHVNSPPLLLMHTTCHHLQLVHTNACGVELRQIVFARGLIFRWSFINCVDSIERIVALGAYDMQEHA